MKSNIEDLIRLAELAKKKDKGTTNALIISALKPEKAEKVAKILTLSAVPSLIAMQENPFWEFPLEEEIEKGDINLGQVLEGNKIGFNFFLPLSIFTEHIGIFGQSGSGKSYLCKHIALQLIKKGIPVWFFDFEDEYSDLFIENPNEFYIVDPGSIKINLFQNPPNVKPLEWLEKLMNVLRESLYLRDGSINMIGEILFQQFKIRGVLDGSSNYPALKDIYREINKLRFRVNSRNAGYWESLNNRCSDLIKLPMFDCKAGLDFPWLMKKSVVFKIGGLSDYHQNLFVNHILTYISSYRERSEDKELLVLLLDEGHRVINYEKAKRADLAEPISFEAARNFRKRGVSLILSDQVPSLIPASWMGNLGTRLVLRLSHGGCIKAISDALALEQEQRAFIPELPRRASILHFIGWKKPFLINIPELSFKRVEGSRIQEFMKEKLRELSYIPCEEEALSIEMRKETETIKKAEFDKAEKRAPDVSLLKEEMDYLESINREPFLPSTERDKKLGISTWRGHSLRKKLISKGILEKILINTGGKGGVITLVKITDKGRAITHSLGMRANILKGKGGFTHQFWADVIKRYFEKTGEASPSIEDDSLGKAVDISLVFQDKKVAVEVELNDNESFNISKDLFSGYDEVWVCCESEEQIKRKRQKVEENVGPEVLDKIKFKLLSEFYERARNIKVNIGALPFGLRAVREEKAIKEVKNVEEEEGKRRRKKRDIPQNINKNKKSIENDFFADDGKEEEKLLTLHEVAEILGISSATAKIWASKRIFPVVKVGRLVRISSKSLREWLDKNIQGEIEVSIVKEKHQKSAEFDKHVQRLRKEGKSR